MLEFLGSALSSDRSITISAFIAQRHGNDPRVRLLASGLTAFALTGLVVCETIGVATILKPVLSGNAWFSYLFIFVVLAFMVLCTIPSGNSGAMYSAQLQLGMLYFGLFGATAFLLYLQVSDLRSMPPHSHACNRIRHRFLRRHPDLSALAIRRQEPDHPTAFEYRRRGARFVGRQGAQSASEDSRRVHHRACRSGGRHCPDGIVRRGRPRHRPRQRRGIAAATRVPGYRVGGVDPAPAVLSDRRHDELAEDRGIREGPGREPGRGRPDGQRRSSGSACCTPPRVRSRGCSCAHSAPLSWCRQRRPAIPT